MQVVMVMGFSPLLAGVTARLKERVRSRRGPSVLQPYRDLWKLFHKDEGRRRASWTGWCSGRFRAVTLGAAHLAARMHRGRLNTYQG